MRYTAQLFLAALLLAGTQQGHAQQVTPEAIRAALAGNSTVSVIGTQRGDPIRVTAFYAPDGTIRARFSAARERDDSGTWEVTAENKICYQWKETFGGVKRCGVVTAIHADAMDYQTSDGNPANSRILKGNPNGL